MIFSKNAVANPNEHIVEKTRKIQEDNVQVLTRDNGSSKNITLIDKKNIHNNRLQVINQYKVNASAENGAKHDNRYDVTVLVNGLPLVHIELKRRGVAIREAFNQINRYQRDSFWAGCGLYELHSDFVNFQWYKHKVLFQQYQTKCGKEHEKRGASKTKTSNSFEFTCFWQMPFTAARGSGPSSRNTAGSSLTRPTSCRKPPSKCLASRSWRKNCGP